MRDQAEKLRLKMENKRVATSIGVISGKGGVGKSNFSTNFSFNMAKKGYEIVIVDMDIGMGNVHILLGKKTKRTLMEYLTGQYSLEDVKEPFLDNIDYISGGSAMATVIEWNDLMFERLLSVFELLQQRYDYIIFDMGAGATEWSLQLIETLDDIIVISTTEPTAIMDAYSMMKYVHMRNSLKNMYIVCNRTLTIDEGKQTLKRLQNTAQQFLQKELKILGSIPEDIHVRKAVQQQQLFSVLYERAPATKAIQKIVETYETGHIKSLDEMDENRFMNALKSIFSKGRG
ncbi:MinD/ParA family protein [Kurthia huakuii]|uniref:MinD/ParA family protein n=1 Tax=Kurthia huakuii TaxID=1421019 RepID=UPI00049623A4|nr:MinD/ParA family protein [Kurthia huakuii]MBM7698312.1 flagellar biosynthesis protein FlhG [Kurthia huakuii]